MKTTKKTAYLVRCIVNMDANHEEMVIVKTTKMHLAAQLAESELRNSGYFHAKTFSIKEVV